MKILAFFLILFTFSSVAYAQDSQGEITVISKGEKAPFDGVLLDNIAASKILASDTIEQKKCDLDCQYKLDIQDAKNNATVETLKLSLDYERKEQLKTVEYYENELGILRDFKTEPPPDDDDLMWSLIGASVGVIATSITFGIIMGVAD